MTQDERLKRAEALLNESGSEQHRRLIEIQEALKEDKKVLQLQAKINGSAAGSVAQKEAQYKLNCIYIDNMTEEERDSGEGLELEIETAELHRDILESRKRVREAERVEVANGWENEEEFPKINPVGLAVAAILGLAVGIVISIMMG